MTLEVLPITWHIEPLQRSGGAGVSSVHILQLKDLGAQRGCHLPKAVGSQRVKSLDFSLNAIGSHWVVEHRKLCW